MENCGTKILEECKVDGANAIPWGEEWTFQTLMGNAVDTSMILIKLGITFAADQLTPNLLKGVNALRCMFQSLGDNTWNLVAAAYWGARGAG